LSEEAVFCLAIPGQRSEAAQFCGPATRTGPCFDQLNLVRCGWRRSTDRLRPWGEGTGTARPAARSATRRGNGLFDQLDIIAALSGVCI
jgi:hypothetical protein